MPATIRHDAGEDGIGKIVAGDMLWRNAIPAAMDMRCERAG